MSADVRSARLQPPNELGVRVILHPGEWLQSAITKWAWQLHVSRGDLLEYFGLGDLTQSELGALGHSARIEVLENVSIATRIPVTDLRNSVMNVFNGGAILMGTRDHDDPLTVRPSRRTPFLRLAGTRYCIECLELRPGVMLASWRLSWTFLCVEHRAILIDTCPSCYQPYKELTHATIDLADPSRCQRATAPGRNADTCDHPVTEHWGVEHVEPSSALLLAQVQVNTLVSHPGGLEVFAHLRALIAALRATDNLPRVADLADLDAHSLDGVLEPEAHPGASAPSDALAMAALTAAALRISREPDQVQTQLIRRTTFERRVASAPTAAHLGPGSARDLLNRYPGAEHYAGARQLVLRAHDEDLSTHQRIFWGTAIPRHVRDKYEHVLADDEPLQTWALRTLPDDFWPAWTIRLDVGSHVTGRALARGLREALKYMNVWEARRVGEAASRARLVERALRPNMLGDRTQTRQILAALGELRLWLTANPSPIDYRSRRTLPTQLFLPGDHWQRIAASVGVNPGGVRRRTCARKYVYHRVTATRQDAGYWTPGFDLKEAEYTPFLLSMTADLQSQLDDYASVLIAVRGLQGPVTWEPELFELPLGAPGRDVDSIDLDRLHTLLRDGEHRLTTLTHELGVTRHHLLTALDRRPPQSTSHRPALEWSASDWTEEIRSHKLASHSLRRR